MELSPRGKFSSVTHVLSAVEMARSFTRPPAMQQNTEPQERILVDIGIRLEVTGGLALGVVNGVERLCLTYPGCRKPTMGRMRAITWTAPPDCAHCKPQKDREGRDTTGSAVEKLCPESFKTETPEVQVGSKEEACGLVGAPGVVRVIEQAPRSSPEMPTYTSPLLNLSRGSH